MAKRSSIVALRMHTIVGLVFDLVNFVGILNWGFRVRFFFLCGGSF